MLKRLTLLLFLSAVLPAACSLPGGLAAVTPAALTLAPDGTEIPATETPTPIPTATPIALGSPGNPLILALPPAVTEAQLPEGESLAAGLAELTGYTIVLVRPDSYSNLVADFGKGNAHLAWLPPFAYVDAYQKGYANAGLASQRFGGDYYGAQFIANLRQNYQSYYDPLTGQNTADAKTALAQFNGGKPCWDDPFSAAGYVIPLGYLAENGVNTKPAAFVEGHSTVVRSVYAEGICDFGATIVDARQSPAIQQEFPDVNSRVAVIWRIDPIIPYDVVVFAATMPQDVRTALKDALLEIVQTEEGKAAVKSLFLVEGLRPVDDSFSEEFRRYLAASGLEVSTLVR